MAPPETLVANAIDYVTFDNLVYPKKVSHYAKSLPEPALPSQDAEEVKHNGPQGHLEPLTIIDDPADWRSSGLKPEDYTYRLTEAEVSEIIAATENILPRGVKDEEGIKKPTRDAYLPHWPTLAPQLKELVHNVTSGRGFQIIKGFPVERYATNRPGLVVAYWGIALVLGRVQSSQIVSVLAGPAYMLLSCARWSRVMHVFLHCLQTYDACNPANSSVCWGCGCFLWFPVPSPLGAHGRGQPGASGYRSAANNSQPSFSDCCSIPGVGLLDGCTAAAA